MKKEKSVYFNEMGKISLLTIEEERDLIVKASEGDKKAQDKLVLSNLRYVVKVANKYKNRGIDIEDLIEAGNVGLIKAARKVSPKWNNRFISYATWWITACIQELLLEMQKDVKLPASQRQELCNSNWNFSSLDKLVENDNGDSFNFGSMLKDNSNVNPEDLYMEKERTQEINKALAKLSAKERKVILEYYGFNDDAKSFSKIGEEMGYTKQGVCCIENRSVKKLKEYLDGNIDFAA